ncbi:nucleotidyl transferase AbiEii/AbiGii toxin family protein [Akkermansia muciniphila]|nr:nucleotidyl transferase AbiEii/AbiGii toxin family protein [Akkermansia muciniphila]QWP65870.1 nucleotidyl transferase AbiEii/AbiGii toxin family protein [Akkermansia muciniphila]
MNVFDEMLASYETGNDNDRLNAVHEVMQQVALGGLYNGGFFNKAAFYGGTCLRIFHGLDRFSEDMDFSLLAADPAFRLDPYFDAITAEFAALGQSIDITTKEKTAQSTIQSAFLKSDTAQYDIHLGRDRKIKIKIEVDTTPPLGFSTEQKLLLQPFSFYTNCFTLPDLYAGKMHALIYRSWKNRVKGRDWYDFEWYMRKNVTMDFKHFCERAYQFGSEAQGSLTSDRFRAILKDRIRKADIRQVKEDVAPFIKDPGRLHIWSTEYFLQLADMMKLA